MEFLVLAAIAIFAIALIFKLLRFPPAFPVHIRKSTDSSALIVVKKGKKKLTAFERMNLTAEDNEHGGNGRDHGNKK